MRIFPQSNRAWGCHNGAVMSNNSSIPFILISVLINVMGLGLVIPVLPKLIETLAGGVELGARLNGLACFLRYTR